MKPTYLWIDQVGEFLEFDEENWKKVLNYVIEVDFWPNIQEICGYHGNAKNSEHTIDISKFKRRINEDPMKVSGP